MVCDACQKKLGHIVTQDVWKTGSRNSLEGGGRKLNENKLLSGKKTRFSPYTTKFNKCTICKAAIHQPGSTYCQGCSYKMGICSMCGVKILQTKNYRQSST